LAATETVRGSELLHLTPREYLAGEKNVKRNYSSLGAKARLRAESGRSPVLENAISRAWRARHIGGNRTVATEEMTLTTQEP
jgi:hypothetical protein